jgi:hypothetical protein
MLPIIGVDILAGIKKVIATLGITLSLIITLVLFYEGIPFLNWWPVNQTPIVGWLIQGEIDRRLESKIQVAVTKERDAWLLALNKAGKERDKIVENKNKEIQLIISKSNQEKIILEYEHELHITSLEEAIKREQDEPSNENTCNILNSPIPDSVFRNIH